MRPRLLIENYQNEENFKLNERLPNERYLGNEEIEAPSLKKDEPLNEEKAAQYQKIPITSSNNFQGMGNHGISINYNSAEFDQHPLKKSSSTGKFGAYNPRIRTNFRKTRIFDNTKPYLVYDFDRFGWKWIPQ